jgi:putative membrane protein
MSTRSKISLAAVALLASVSLAWVAYADQPNPVQNANQAVQNANQAAQNATQPIANQNANPQNAEQPAATQPGQTNAAQQGAFQQGTAQAQPGGQGQPYQVNMNPALQGGAAQAALRNIDLFFIPCLINTNNAEIALSRIAEQRAQSQEVKQFAQEMIKEHTALLQKAQELQTRLNQQMHPQSPSATPAAAALFEVNQEIDQTCLANAQRELEQLQGSDFDHCYAGIQVGLHMHADAALSVLKNHARSPELKQAIEEAQQVVSHHLDEAKKLVKSLSQQGENNRSNTTGTSNR